MIFEKEIHIEEWKLENERNIEEWRLKNELKNWRIRKNEKDTITQERVRMKEWLKRLEMRGGLRRKK
jgi:hypothetical protein